MKADQSHFGYVAAVRGNDANASLAEIAYSLDNLQADGICLFTSYECIYLGDPSFVPIWEELSHRKAIVFIYPNIPMGYHPISKLLSAPIFDYP